MPKILLPKNVKAKLISHFVTPVQGLIRRESEIHAGKNLNLYHRYVVLRQGKADLDEDSYGLTGEEKVALYSYYYFQMHFSSTATLLDEIEVHLIKHMKGKNTLIIDYGCGPFTAGLAFERLVRLQGDWVPELEYIGIDLSKNMLASGEKLFLEIKEPRKIKRGLFYSDADEALQETIGKITADTLLIINFAFLFASESIVVDEIVGFARKLTHESGAGVVKTVILQQNPKPDFLSAKWRLFKAKMEGFKSVNSFPRKIPYSYMNDFGSSDHDDFSLKASVDILINF